jgi:hypothetical protein
VLPYSSVGTKGSPFLVVIHVGKYSLFRSKTGDRSLLLSLLIGDNSMLFNDEGSSFYIPMFSKNS